MTGRRFLDEVYDLTGVDQTRALYDAWAGSYDAEIGEAGYATPGRIAAALAGALQDRDAPVLDFGCGTGLSGMALAAAGFGVIDGCDLSAEMLERAQARGCYRRLWRATGAPDASVGPYAAVAAVGVVSAGGAPPETLEALGELLGPGGLLAFSFNDHTFDDAAYEVQVAAMLAAGDWRQRLREDGPHLPGIDLRATVFLLERL